MTKTELEAFAEMDKAVGLFIGKTVRVIFNDGWVQGNLKFNHSWYVTGENLEFSFDTDDVSRILKNYIYLHAKKPQ